MWVNPKCPSNEHQMFILESVVVMHVLQRRHNRRRGSEKRLGLLRLWLNEMRLGLNKKRLWLRLSSVIVPRRSGRARGRRVVLGRRVRWNCRIVFVVGRSVAEVAVARVVAESGLETGTETGVGVVRNAGVKAANSNIISNLITNEFIPSCYNIFVSTC
jgi:hypothetical protein